MSRQSSYQEDTGQKDFAGFGQQQKTWLLSLILQGIHEDEEHILLSCGSLSSTRQTLTKFTLNQAQSFPHLSDILLKFTSPDHPEFFQFLLDCSALPEVISFAQLHGKESIYNLFKVTRTWCYPLHRDRLKLLGRWSHC